MGDRPNQQVVRNANALLSLSQVLDHSERIKNVVEECAEELSSSNAVLKQEMTKRAPLPEVEHALVQSEQVENKVEECAEELASVNDALVHEVSARHQLERELNTAKEQVQEARHQAYHDPLTGLPNRVLFNDRLDHGLAQAKRHDWFLAVMFVDLEDFKHINDSYGHAVGDMVLKIIGHRLKDTVREEDTVCHLGGGKFLYAFSEVENEKHIAAIARKIIHVINEPCDVKGENLNINPLINPHIGIAVFPKDGTAADALLKNADKAMHRAKHDIAGYAFYR